jgi:uncharacterized protein YjcR
MRDRGMSFASIAEKYKISKATVAEIYYRELWLSDDMPMPDYVAKKVLKKLSTV